VVAQLGDGGSVGRVSQNLQAELQIPRRDADETCPKLKSPTVEFGAPNCGVLKKLNASNRN
jgi:hypothetical protein